MEEFRAGPKAESIVAPRPTPGWERKLSLVRPHSAADEICGKFEGMLGPPGRIPSKNSRRGLKRFFFLVNLQRRQKNPDNPDSIYECGAPL